MGKTIALFGGTFDPVHHGHLIVARAVAERCGFDRITFVPTARPPHKGPACASGRHRLRMLELAIEGEQVFDVCDCELDRTGHSYTFDTVTELRRNLGADADVRLVIGADMLEELPQWHRCEELLELVRIVVAVRPPWDQRVGEVLRRLSQALGPQRAEKLRESVVETPLIEVSSTLIRDRVKAGESIRYLVPESVRAYIESHRLYGPGRDAK